MKYVELSEQEIQAALTLFDLAVKAGGLNVAESAIVLAKKFQAAPDVDGPPDLEPVA